jgi:hypothetical protein
MTSTGQPSATGAVPSHNVPSILPEQLEIEQWFQELEANTLLEYQARRHADAHQRSVSTVSVSRFIIFHI